MFFSDGGGGIDQDCLGVNGNYNMLLGISTCLQAVSVFELSEQIRLVKMIDSLA